MSSLGHEYRAKITKLEAEVERLNKRVAELERVLDAAKEIMWCDACGHNYSNQYDALEEALKDTEDE